MTKPLALIKSDRCVYQLIFTHLFGSLQLCFLHLLKLDYKL